LSCHLQKWCQKASDCSVIARTNAVSSLLRKDIENKGVAI